MVVCGYKPLWQLHGINMFVYCACVQPNCVCVCMHAVKIKGLSDACVLYGHISCSVFCYYDRIVTIARKKKRLVWAPSFGGSRSFFSWFIALDWW